MIAIGLTVFFILVYYLVFILLNGFTSPNGLNAFGSKYYFVKVTLIVINVFLIAYTISQYISVDITPK